MGCPRQAKNRARRHRRSSHRSQCVGADDLGSLDGARNHQFEQFTHSWAELPQQRSLERPLVLIGLVGSTLPIRSQTSFMVLGLASNLALPRLTAQHWPVLGVASRHGKTTKETEYRQWEGVNADPMPSISLRQTTRIRDLSRSGKSVRSPSNPRGTRC